MWGGGRGDGEVGRSKKYLGGTINRTYSFDTGSKGEEGVKDTTGIPDLESWVDSTEPEKTEDK